MTDDRPSIAELQRETSRWPDDWKPALGEEGQWDGFWWCRDHNGDEERVATDTVEDYANDLARHIAELVNSAPVLLEIAALALAYAEPNTDEGRALAWGRLHGALSKVRP